MSKYVTTRMEKIKELSEKLNNVNTKIENYITILEKIKKEHNIFSINYSLVNDIKEDLNIKCFNYNFYILFENHYVYNIDITFDLQKNIPEKFQHIITIIQEHINLLDFANSIFAAHCMYDDIENLYFDIKIKYGQFAKTSNNLISHLKKMIKNKIIESNENYYYGYFSIKKDNYDESIYFVYQTYQYGSNALYQVKLPLIEHVEQIYAERNIDSQYNKNLYIAIFKELFFKLNQEFFNFLNINEYSIDFRFDLDEQLSNFNVDYTKSHTYNLILAPFNQSQINIILDKLKIAKDLDNF